MPNKTTRHTTRQYLEQLVGSLEAQKRERDEELGAQRHLVQTLQREVREKEQEVQNLREMVVHLRTRVRWRVVAVVVMDYGLCVLGL